MNTRRAIHYDHDKKRTVVLDRFPNQKVCAYIHRLTQMKTAILKIETFYNELKEPYNPYIGMKHD